ncbi:sensor domain-containing diguanylate cyclase [Pendulispora brunnea]|uniref:diguanylate cyclase n=1 Tax=Pendulispora brunnea TaxID=2905690 RepID=A0ABZ2KFU7_9BACT
MDPLVRGSLLVRRIIRRGHGLAFGCALGAYVIAGGATAPLGMATTLAVMLFVVLLVPRLRARWSHDRTRSPRSPESVPEVPLLLDLELGVLLTIGLNAALLRFEGTLDGVFSPVMYVLVALVAALARPAAAILVLASVIGFEALVRHYLLLEPNFDKLTPHAVFAVTFAILNLAFLRVEVARTRAAARARVEAELRRLKDDARSYRLLGAGEANPDAEDRLARSSVEEIHQSVHYALDLLRHTLGLHTAVLLWLNDAETHFKISELSTESDDIHDAPIAVGDGVLGAVAAKRERVTLGGLKPSYKVPYYAGACPVSVLSAIPVLEGLDALRGVLIIDRRENRAFTAHEEDLAAQAARYCLRAIQNERVFVQLERAKVEQGKLYRAAQALGAATSEQDVLEAGVRAAREIASFDLAAVTIYDEATRIHEVCAAKSANGQIDDLVGMRFSHNTGLVSMVVQNRFPLPYKGQYDPTHQTVLTRRHPWPKLPSLLVLPLLQHEKPLGTLILGARRRNAFGESVRPTLEVLASHLAVSLSNARMVHKLEMMATTDGLTGLLNKRAMLEAATQKVAAAARFGRKLSVMVTDIDFFKKVNDTYGHDIGDVVIKGLADILQRQRRATDLVARFGGEEFVVLCEETNEEGAMLLAERIRQELGKTVFHTPNGKLQVTCSIGIATFNPRPASAAAAKANGWDALFKAADEALYVSKRTGRNRCTAAPSPGGGATARTEAPAGGSRLGKTARAR